MIFSKDKLLKLKRALLSLKEVSTKEGVILITDSDTFEPGMEVFVDSDEGLIPAKDGIYTAGETIVVIEGGKIASMSEKPIEQPVEEEQPIEEEVVETVEETPIEEQPTEEEEPIEGPTVEELQAIIDEQKAMIESLKSENESLKAENDELQRKLSEPVAEPAEEEFKKENPVMGEKKIDFSKYIKNRK